MKELTVLFPAAAILFVLLLGSVSLRAAALPRREDGRCRRMDRRDRLLAWGLTALYALVAFWQLGDTAAPETYLSLAPWESAEIDLGEARELGSLRWYAGLSTGRWTLEWSDDGVRWQPLTELDQNYVSLFKWNTAELEATVFPRYLRLSGDEQCSLGELQLRDAAGAPFLPADAGAAACLFDEQDLVPDRPSFMNSSYFDEIYHPRTALEGLRGSHLYEITHPPLGKLLLSAGIALFGMTPFGWRFMGTLTGALMLPVLYAFLKRLFGRRELAACGLLIFAFDFMHFTQTRLATIDTYGVFFTLLMYYFFFCWLFPEEGESGRRQSLHLALAGLAFGLGAASKWTCLYAGAGLGVLWLIRWLRSGEFFRPAFWKNVRFCLVFFVAVPVLVYVLSYWPYGRADGLGWPGMYFTRRYYQLIWENQQYMLRYHSQLVATHPYSSKWWQWMLDIRPILYYLDYYGDGSKSAIAAFTSPLLCWGGLLALLRCAWAALRERDGRAGFILLGFLAQLLPWVLVPRLTFAYHFFPSELFLVLALAWAFDDILARTRCRWPLYAFTAASLLLFACFYPVLSGARVSGEYCALFLQWMGTWPI